MKKLGLLLVVLLCSYMIDAQTSGGPDAFGYTWKSNLHSVNPPAYSWVDISTRGTLIPRASLGDDGIAGPFALTNGFRYYWYNPTQFYVGANGFISFDGDNIASTAPFGFPVVPEV